MRSLIIFSLICLKALVLPADGSPSSEKDAVLVNINGTSITAGEFARAYRRNNIEIEVLEQKTPHEYLELYINFHLKVKQAKALGLDTNPEFIRELRGYREQLARPYMSNPDHLDAMVEEAWERMQWDIRASHILLSIDPHAMPADTLRAWEHIMELYRRIQSGENFSDLAETYSDDPFARDMPPAGNNPGRPGNRGDRGYFTVLNMVYPFETAAYNTPVGEVSLPVRSSFGYHLVKVTDRLPAMGTARVAHIMLMTPRDAEPEKLLEAEQTIQEIHRLLMQGDDFADLAAQFSQDRQSASRGGEMPPFTSNRMVPEFIEAIHKLDSAGQISPPVRSQFGWHIIKLLDKEPPSDDAMSALRDRVSRDVRAEMGARRFVKSLQKEYGFAEDRSALEALYGLVHEDIFEARWELPERAGLDAPLMWFADRRYTQRDFAEFLAENQTRRVHQEIPLYVNAMYDRFIQERLLAYEDTQLERKHPAFRELMAQYHDGILLFELTDRKVWSRASADTTGLRDYYERNLDSYVWGESVEAVLFGLQEAVDAEKLEDRLREAWKIGHDAAWVLGHFNRDGDERLTVREGRFYAEESPWMQSISIQEGFSGWVNVNGEERLVLVQEIYPAQARPLKEIRGLVIADYQHHLEKKWVESLREQYRVEVDWELLERMTF